MAQHVIGGANVQSSSSLSAPSLHTVIWLRLTFGLVTLLGAVTSYFALAWDVQWHTFVGRDRTLTPPHILLLSGIVISGIAALLAVIVETSWIKKNQDMAQRYTPFARSLAAPLGIYITGYAALNMAVAFPVDQYWHTLYGVDVTIWAPFHIMAIGGLALMAFGAVYTLVSVANLATSLHEVKERRTGYIGAIVAMAISLATFSVLAAEGIDPDKFLLLGFTSIDLFPALQGLLLGTLLVAIAYATPWKWAAASVVGVVALVMIIGQLTVPPALVWLMQSEQLTFRAVHKSEAPQLSALTFTWPMLSIISAIMIDIFIQRAQKRNMSTRQLNLALGIAVLIGCFPLTLANTTAILDTIANLNILGMVLTLSLAVLAIYGGIALGRNIGETMKVSER